jgi:cytochrome P450
LIHRIAEQLLDEVDAGIVEVVEQYARPLASRMTAELLGVDPALAPQIERWSRTMSLRMELGPRSPAARAEQQQAATALRALLWDELRDRVPLAVDGGLVTCAARACQQPGTDDRTDRRAGMAVQLALIAMASNEPTVALVAGAIDLLLTRDRRHGRRADVLDERAVDELIRLVSPVQVRPRSVTETVTMEGTTLRAGQQVLVFLAAANRDPAVFRRPDHLDLQRAPNPHLGFGYGRHVCLGQHVARAVVRIATSAFIRRFPDALTDGAGQRYEDRFAVRVPSSVPVRVA